MKEYPNLTVFSKKKFKSKLPRVAFITNTVAPYRRPLFEEIGKHTDLTVICSASNEPDRDWRDWDERNCSSFKTVVLKGLSLKTKHGMVCFQPGLVLVLRKLRPDIVINSAYSLNTMIGTLYAKATRTPSIIWSASTILSERKYSVFRLCFRILLVKLNYAYVTVGLDAMDYLTSLGASKDKCFRAVNAVENVTCHPEFGRMRKEAKRIRFEYPGTIILYSGQLIKRKGLDLLLAAYENVRNNTSVLLIIGSGPLEQKLKEEVSQKNLRNVHFIGFKQERELWPYYIACDVYVLPTREDTWGMVVNEAMQCELPVVCSKFAGAARELVVNGKTGFVVDPYDRDGFAKVLTSIVKDGDLRKKMGKTALEGVEEYSIENSAIVFLRAIAFCLQKRGWNE